MSAKKFVVNMDMLTSEFNGHLSYARWIWMENTIVAHLRPRDVETPLTAITWPVQVSFVTELEAYARIRKEAAKCVWAGANWTCHILRPVAAGRCTKSHFSLAFSLSATVLRLLSPPHASTLLFPSSFTRNTHAPDTPVQHRSQQTPLELVAARLARMQSGVEEIRT